MDQIATPPTSIPPSSATVMRHLRTLETDGTILFFQHVQACQTFCDAKNILDFGAGRGGALVAAREAGNRYKAYLHDLRSLGAHVTACDIDGAVLDNQGADERVVMTDDERLPFADESFDLIVSDNTFEHVEKADKIAAELLRILRPGGFICARTPNRFGYVAIAAALMPKTLYSAVLTRAQPHRRDEDKFEVHYRLNDPAAIKRHFAPHEVYIRYPNFEPSYFFGSRLLKGGFKLLHHFLPKRLRTGIIITVHKTARPGA
ncbi:MAG: class I SAM-dependent methyltransferase [Sphingopyxis sp.]|uniref:class I SAM-dependent methyltransferase n=1 Tax=Sphingopyxis sp. TaxID=1908224 RepID=UPI003D8119D9